MFTDADTTFIDAIVQTGNVSLLLDNIVSLKENPDVEIVKPLSDLVIALVKHDLGREIVIESQIVLPILSWYFSDDEKLKEIWFDVLVQLSALRQIRQQLESTKNFTAILKRVIKTATRKQY
jgi:hypothetical protein